MAGTAAFGATSLAAKGLLTGLDHGDWEVRFRSADGGRQHICFDGGRQLIQIRHASLNCASTVVTESPSELTVQYTCPGHGYGRTNIRRETSRLVQIDSQGIERGIPFAFAAEARRVGSCRS